MLVRSLLASVAVAAAAVDATKILVPLYSYSESCWPELQQAAATNPSASFIGIINPDSGPGSSDVEDPSLYCIPVLRQNIPNLSLVGYVRTTYGARDPNEVAKDVQTYKTWAGLTVSAGGVSGSGKLDGIFFDETPTFTDSTAKFSQYTWYSQITRTAFGKTGVSTIVFNPGTYANPRLYSYGDFVVSYEDAWAKFGAAKAPSSSLLQKSIVMAHTFPNSTATLQSAVRTLVPKYGGVYITNVDINYQDVYQSFGSNWQTFVKDVAAIKSKARRTLQLE
ncbi:hypothetical protein JCM8097_000657 [Rhodosporidiobolus ruineniae]